MSSHILTSPKPVEPDDWLLDTTSQKAFFYALLEYLARNLVPLLPDRTEEQCADFFRRKISPIDHESDIDALVLKGLGVDFVSSDRPLVVSGVHFPPNDPRQGFDYHKLLEALPNLVFQHCDFFCKALFDDYKSTGYRFAECRFHAPWCLQEGASGPGPEHPLFDACEFHQGVGLEGGGGGLLHSCLAIFRNCSISGELSLSGVRTDIPVFSNDHAHRQSTDKITVENCELEGRFTLANTAFIGEVDLSSTVFHDKFAFINVDVGRLCVRNVNFNGLADFFGSTFETFLVRKSIFRDFAGFEDCQFGEQGAGSVKRIVLTYASFYSFTNFRGAHFRRSLDLRNANFKEQPNFLGCKFESTARISTDRETFRIIKQSFEAVGNRIEANAFYALEMEAYRRELQAGSQEHGWAWHFWERLLVKVNHLISLHGQSYWRPVLGIVLLLALVALQRANWENGWVVLPAALSRFVGPVVDVLNAWASGFVLFHSLYEHYAGQEAFILVVAVMLSTCVWHFLAAARRHHKR